MPMSLAQPPPNRRGARPETIAPQPHAPAHIHWGEPHPVSATPLIYASRDEHELEVVLALLRASYRYAVGSGQA